MNLRFAVLCDGSVMKRRRWGFHFCWRDEYGAPKRIYVNTPWFHLGIAMTPGDRYVGRWGVGTHWIDFRRHD